MKLKTLKDIEPQFQMERDEFSFGDLFGREDLRSVAREWVKHIDNFEPKRINDEEGIDHDLNWSFYHRDLLSNWISMFFNLEDSDGEEKS